MPAECKIRMSFLLAVAACFAPCRALAQEENLPAVSTATAQSASVPGAPVAVPPLPGAVPADEQSASSVPAAAVAASTVTMNVNFEPAQDRDPMRSPQDFADDEYERNKVKHEEEKRRKAALAAAQAANPVPLDPKQQAKLVIKSIKLQGIVGDQAIINDKMHSIGEVINGAKITKITPEGVSFTYKSFTFTKKMAEF
ncbi:MAG: hypothetical protein GX410_06555 [Elusimicrobia bacterium]|nr:hypothetical protein [Elusimicrobiota bacterium]